MERPTSRTRTALLIVAAWSVPSVIGTVGRIIQWKTLGGTSNLWVGVFNSIIPWITWMLITPLVIWAARRLPVLSPVRIRAVLAHFVIGVVLSHGYILTAASLAHWRTGQPFELIYVSYLPLTLPVGLFLYTGIVFAVSWIDDRHRLYESTLQASLVERQLSQARLDALRERLRPHFLFNALNSISASVRTDRKDHAVTLIARLGDLLRRVVEVDQRTEIPLSIEIALVNDYLHIEQERFGDRMDVRVDVPAGLERAMLPSLMLQPLVENAVIHGIAPFSGPARLQVRAVRDGDTLVLTVENDGAPYAPGQGEGVGLGNVRERLEQLYGTSGQLTLHAREGGGCRAVARLPWREEPGDS